MARETARRKTVREQVDLSGGNSPQLQEQRRFFQSRGNDRAVREARAIADAFKIGTQFAGDVIDRNNAKGRERVAEDVVAGRDRNADDKNAAYHRTWDALDAERDLNLAKQELPEILRGANWEDMNEDQVRQIINKYGEENFKGAEGFGEGYASVLAPSLLKLETELFATHRDMQIQRVQSQQFGDLQNNAELRFNDAGGDLEAVSEIDGLNIYQYIAQGTGTFADGPNKKVKYWEMVFDLAIKNGRPDMITGAPDRFPNGEPTAKNTDQWLDEKRAAVAAAENRAAHILAKEEAEAEEQRKTSIFDTQLLIAQKAFRGEDTSEEVGLLRSLGAGFSDVTAATNFGQGQLDEFESRSSNLQYEGHLWNAIYSDQAGLSDVMEAWRTGELGGGPQAVAKAEKMMETVRQLRESARRSDSSAVSTYRGEVKALYNPAHAGMFAPLDQAMLHIQTEAVANFNRLVLEEGMDPAEARARTREKFDPLVDRESEGAQSQSSFATEARIVSPQDAIRFANDEIDARTFVQGQTRATIEASLDKMIEDESISIEQAESIILKLF